MRKVSKIAIGTRKNTHNGKLTTPALCAAYFARYTSADMRDMSFHSGSPLLPKILSGYETVVIFHALDPPGDDYTLLCKATYEILTLPRPLPLPYLPFTPCCNGTKQKRLG